MLNLVCMGFSMIDQSLVDTVDLYILDGKDLPIRHAEELIDAYVKLIEQNAELYKEITKHKTLVEDVAALGFLELTHDSGKSHRDVCKKFKGLFPDE